MRRRCSTSRSSTPATRGGNGLVRKVIYPLPFGRRGESFELVKNVQPNRGYDYVMLRGGLSGSVVARAGRPESHPTAVSRGVPPDHAGAALVRGSDLPLHQPQERGVDARRGGVAGAAPGVPSRARRPARDRLMATRMSGRRELVLPTTPDFLRLQARRRVSGGGLIFRDRCIALRSAGRRRRRARHMARRARGRRRPARRRAHRQPARHARGHLRAVVARCRERADRGALDGGGGGAGSGPRPRHRAALRSAPRRRGARRGRSRRGARLRPRANAAAAAAPRPARAGGAPARRAATPAPTAISPCSPTPRAPPARRRA